MIMKTYMSKQILIECKSLPRSGLHFLNHTLGTHLGDCFSFCERYNEPGCCKKFPCALHYFLDEARSLNLSHIRLAKSHDFALNDRVFNTSPTKRLLILKRDPIFVLTSWWELEEIVRHKELLIKYGIDPKKILYLHESALVDKAIQLIDKNFMVPSENEFRSWLNRSSRYVLGFQDKWLHRPRDPYTQVVDYEKVGAYARKLILEVMPSLKNSKALNVLPKTFTPRSDPFNVRSKKITEFLQARRSLILLHLKKKGLISASQFKKFSSETNSSNWK